MMETIFPNASQFDRMNDILAAIAVNMGGGMKLNSFADVKTATKLGLAKKLISVGDQFETEKDGDSLTFDVVDFDKHTPHNEELSHTVALMAHDIVGTKPFSFPQLLYYTENGLATGRYKFTLQNATYTGGAQYNGDYWFTLTNPIPAGGGFRLAGVGGYKGTYAKTDVLGKKLLTYGALPARDVIEQEVEVFEWDGEANCTDLGTFYDSAESDDAGCRRNSTTRNIYGTNRWRDSVIRQWLNSDAPAVAENDNVTVSHWWTPQTVFDIPTEVVKLAGFLNGVDPDFVSSLCAVEVKSALCDADKTENETFDITVDKIFLPSVTEIFGNGNGGLEEGSQLAYWEDAENDDRKKYRGGNSQYWWLRSFCTPRAYGVRYVTPVGALGNYRASYAYGIVPMCCIG